MEFRNRKEFILRGPTTIYGYFKLREFRIRSDNSYSNEDVINYFIKSSHFLWQDGGNAGEDWKFHGKHDASKIVASDFTREPYEKLKQELLDFISSKCGSGIVQESGPFKVDAKQFVKQLMQDPLGYARNHPGNIKGKEVDYSDEIKLQIESTKKILNDYSNSGIFFKLALSEKDKQSKFGVYDYFFSAIMINTKTNTFVTIEFGLD